MTTEARPRVLSGIQPTADSFHLGNYLGAVRQWVAMQDDHDAFYFVPDLHALTVEHDPKTLAARTRNGVAQLLALGLDPARCTVFVQSHVPEHAELEWVLGCITGFGEASRMTQFKDKTAQAAGTTAPSVGLFTYPILQAADILLYQADRVPVGEDQRQHVELTRDLAQRFNTPIRADVHRARAVHPRGRGQDPGPAGPDGEDEQVGSTPAGIVNLLDDPKVSAKKIRSAVTDTEREIRYDPRAQAGRLQPPDDLRGAHRPQDQRAGGGVRRARLRRPEEGSRRGRRGVHGAAAPSGCAAYLDDPAELDRVLAAGAARAREVAGATLKAVYDRVGFLPPVR